VESLLHRELREINVFGEYDEIVTMREFPHIGVRPLMHLEVIHMV
jgi:hypothetical protein